MADLPDDILDALGAVPLLRGIDRCDVSASKLDGLSNANFLLETPRGRFVLRVPKHDSGGFVDRAREIKAARIAARLGIGAELVDADPATGLLLTRWIEGARPLSGRDIRRDPDLLRRIGRTFARLHGSGCAFPGLFDPFAIMTRYEAGRVRLEAGDDPRSDRLRTAIGEARAALNRSSVPLVPSHCDPVPENILDNGTRLFLIDWEYAGMNDPAWDLAYLALESGLGPDDESALLAAYDDPAVTHGRIQVYKLLAAALGALWSVLQAGTAEAQRFAEWGARRLETAEALANDPRLPLWKQDIV